MRPSLLLVLGVASVAVWTLALVGLVNIVSAVTSDRTPAETRPAPLLAPDNQGTRVAGIGGLQHLPGTVRVDYATDRFGDVVVTEAEFGSTASIASVRQHYRDELEGLGWSVDGVRWEFGEWIYSLSSGRRALVLEFEQRDGVTEIELELATPIAGRGMTTDR